MNREQIRAIFQAHGFTVKEGQTDLKPYVYEAAEALLKAFTTLEVAPALDQVSDDLETSHNSDGMYAADVHGDRDPVIDLNDALYAVDEARKRFGIDAREPA